MTPQAQATAISGAYTERSGAIKKSRTLNPETDPFDGRERAKAELESQASLDTQSQPDSQLDSILKDTLCALSEQQATISRLSSSLYPVMRPGEDRQPAVEVEGSSVPLINDLDRIRSIIQYNTEDLQDRFNRLAI